MEYILTLTFNTESGKKTSLTINGTFILSTNFPISKLNFVMSNYC